MKIHEIMSQTIVTAGPESTIRDLWKKLFSKHVNAIPVVDKKGFLVGLVTKEDLLKILYPDYQEYFADLGAIEDFEAMEGKVHDLGNTKAQDIMCKRVVYTRSDTPIMRALSRMIVRRINQLPVLDDKNKVIGMVTKGDVFYALVKKEVGPKKVEKPSSSIKTLRIKAATKKSQLKKTSVKKVVAAPKKKSSLKKKRHS